MTDYRIVPATIEHIERVAAHMRKSDRDEVFAAGAVTALEALRHSFDCSDESWAGLADGEPICIFGVAPRSMITGTGVPWLLGTPEIEKHALPFLRRSRRVMSEWRSRFELLENHVDARNTKSIQWLRWLGFTIHDAIPYGPFNLPFHPFEKRS